MFSRAIMIPTLLAASLGIPYLATNPPEWLEGWQQGSSNVSDQLSGNGKLESLSASSAECQGSRNLLDSVQGPGAVLYPVNTPLEGKPGMPLEEVLRTDITKEWVYQRWARKSTGLADLEHYGIRIPLVTGTQLSDLAGSLTYLFDANGQLERISFYGTTGDTTRLVMHLVSRFHLQRQATVIPGEQLYQLRKGEDVFSELRTMPASVLWSSSPHSSFAVELELQRPHSTTPLPKKVPLSADPAHTTSQRSEAINQDQNPAIPQADKVEGESDPGQKWNVLFPRSQVPPDQLDNLDQRGRIW